MRQAMIYMTDFTLPDTDKRKEIPMNQISEKELSALNDLFTGEELLIKKFQVLADNSTDSEMKAKFTEISNEHKEHFRSLYSQLS